MNPTLRPFRLLLIGTLCVGIAGALVDLIVPSTIPDALRDAYEAYIAAEPALPAMVIGLVVLVAGFAATIGLLLLKRWSRPLALWVTVVSLVISPALGAVVISGWAQMLVNAATISWGAALAMAYFSEVRTHFDS